MDKHIIFKNGQQVCKLGQGTYKMGRRRSEEIQALRRGIELGLTLIDTAEMYGTEDLVGEAVRNCRDKAFIVSKVLPGNASYEGTKHACEHSLMRLGTDYIDLYLLHWAGRYPLSETVCALVELQKEGKIRQWGMSNLDVADMEQISLTMMILITAEQVQFRQSQGMQRIPVEEHPERLPQAHHA